MIRPTKYLDVDSCVLNSAAHILVLLSSAGAMQYDDLLRATQVATSKKVRFEFVLALDLLYLLGKVEYHEDLDALTLAQPAEGSR